MTNMGQHCVLPHPRAIRQFLKCLQDKWLATRQHNRAGLHRRQRRLARSVCTAAGR